MLLSVIFLVFLLYLCPVLYKVGEIMEYGRSEVRWDAVFVYMMRDSVVSVWASTLQPHINCLNTLPAGCFVFCLNGLFRTSD